MKSTALRFAALSLLLAPLAALRAGDESPIVGAIRWDGWYGEGTVTKAVEASLGQPKYHFRLPWFAQLQSDGSVRINGDSQAIMEQELAYAAAARLNYWAVVDYWDEAPGMSIALNRYLAAKDKRGIRYCLVEEGHRLDKIGSAGWKRLVEHFQRPDYQTVLDGRPLLFVFGKPTTLGKAEWDDLRRQTLAAGLKSPYLVLMGYRPEQDAQDMTAIGFDAVSAYARGGSYSMTQPTYAEQCVLIRRERWEKWQALRVPSITFASAGWDTRPRNERPPFWMKNEIKAEPDPTPTAQQKPLIDGVTATPDELAAHVGEAVKWAATHRDLNPANAIIIYAWNEHDEGGWLQPTRGADEKADDSRVVALGKALHALQPPVVNNAAAQDAALVVTPLNTKPGAEYQSAARLYQGVPGIARDEKSGRLWATWYSGGRGESVENYVLVVTSGDDGATWTEPVLVVDPPHPVRTFDSCLWTSPDGRLWFFYCQNEATKNLHDGRWGVWYSICNEPARADAAWTEPVRIRDGIMLNKPTVLRDGSWLLPVAHWYDRKHGAGIVRSTDQGRTFEWIGGAPGRNADWIGTASGGGMEHIIIERKNGSLWMPMRIKDGLAETTSRDGGVTWSEPVRSALAGPGSRFHVRRLKSGRLLLVNHFGFSPTAPILAQRSHLTAMLSEDDGKTWPHRLLLDDREQVSYPDTVETPDGKLYIIYDRGRSSHREILLAITNEADIIAGQASSATKLRMLVNKATGQR